MKRATGNRKQTFQYYAAEGMCFKSKSKFLPQSIHVPLGISLWNLQVKKKMLNDNSFCPNSWISTSTLSPLLCICAYPQN